MTAEGQVLAALPGTPAPAVTALHSRYGRWNGEITVEGPGNRVFAAMLRLAGLPPSMTSEPLAFETETAGVREVWTRYLGGTVMRSYQWRKGEDRVAERLGPITVVSTPHIEGDGTVRLDPVAWRMLGLPLLPALAPRIETRESGEDDLYRFDVRIGWPVTGGTILRYHGFLNVTS